MTQVTSHARWYLLRHARPLVAAGICYGQLDVAADVAATEEAAAAFARHWHAAHGGLQQTVQIISSPLRRCRQLAHALGRAQPGIAGATRHQVDAALTELDFGTWEGVPWNAWPTQVWHNWEADFAHYRLGGGESTAQMLQRVHTAAHDTARHLLAQPQTVRIWVTHAGVMRALHWLQEQGNSLPESASQWPQQGACGYGQWLALHDTAVHTLAGLE